MSVEINEKKVLRTMGRTLSFYALIMVTGIMNVNRSKGEGLLWFGNMFVLIVTVFFFLLLVKDYNALRHEKT